MQEQTIETSDERIGLKFIVGANGNYARISVGKIGDNFNVNDEVYVLTASEHSDYLQQKKNNAEYLEKINQLQQEIDNTDIKAMEKQHAVYEKQIDKLTKSNNSYKQWNTEFKAKIEDLKQTIADLKERNDKIAKQLEDSIDASEIEDSQKEIQQLKEQVNEYKSKYENMISDYTKTNDECIAYLDENKKLKETNQFLNEQVGALTSTFNRMKDELESNYKSSNQELKETIKKHQLHIDELTEKYQSLLNKEDYIAPASHYDEVLALTNQLNDAKLEINKLNGEIETKLAVQKSEMDSEHNNEKAQMLVAYNKELDNLKLQYNNLANSYNSLLDELDSITKWNALFDSRHEKIRKDKEHVPPLEIISEQLPPADEDIVEYVPKNESMD